RRRRGSVAAMSDSTLPSSSNEIKVELLGAIAVVTIDRIHKRNALSPAMLDALCAIWAQLPAAGARAIVLTGAGDLFSAGVDLAALPAGSGAAAAPATNPMGAAL